MPEEPVTLEESTPSQMKHGHIWLSKQEYDAWTPERVHVWNQYVQQGEQLSATIVVDTTGREMVDVYLTHPDFPVQEGMYVVTWGTRLAEDGYNRIPAITSLALLQRGKREIVTVYNYD